VKNLVEKFLTVLEKLPQVLRGDFFIHNVFTMCHELSVSGNTPSIAQQQRPACNQQQRHATYYIVPILQCVLGIAQRAICRTASLL